ncbi:MAG TPA: PAS domain S-box protein [Synergistaceae bacterium]|nr:PAS domain S-box protein [Synergistaceae bacterium]
MHRKVALFSRLSKKRLFFAILFFLFLGVGGVLSLVGERFSSPLVSEGFGQTALWQLLLVMALFLLGAMWGKLRNQGRQEKLLEKIREELLEQGSEKEGFRELFSALFHKTNSGVLFISPGGEIRDCNARFCLMLGESREEIRSSNLFALVENEIFHEIFSRDIKVGGGEFQGDFPLRQWNRSLYVHCRFFCVDPENPDKGILCVFQDLTREYRMRRDLEESEDFLNMVINFLPVGLLFVDDSTDIICRANEYIMRRLGKEEELFSERPYSELVQRIPFSEENPASSGDMTSEKECFLRGENEKLLPVLRNYVYVRYRDQVLRLESFVDMGERKKAEEALRKSRQALEEANALAHLGNFEMDLFSGEIFISGEFYRIFGLQAGEVQHFGDLLAYIYPGDRKNLLDLFEEMKKACSGGNYKKEYSCEVRMKRPYRGMGWFVLRARIDLSGEDACRIFATIQDITELRLMEKAVRENEKKYRGIFESLQDVYFRCNYGGFILEISPSVKKFGGYEPGQLLGLEAGIFFENPSEREALLDRLLEKGAVSDFELALKGSDGKIRNVSVNCHLLRDSEGALQGYEGMIRDISDRIRGDRAVRSSEQKFRGIFEYSRDAIVLIREGRFIDCNNRALQIFGYDAKEDFFLMTPVTLSPELQPGGKNSKDFLRVVGESLRQGVEEIPIFEWLFLRKNGESFWAEVQLSPILLEEAPAVQALVRDVTERKKQEDQRRILSEVIHQSPLSIIVCDAQGSIEYVNAFFQLKTGCSQEVMQGKSLYTYLRERMALCEEELRELLEDLRQGNLWKGEGRGSSPEGTAYVEHLWVVPIFDESQHRMLRIACMGEDVTEQKHMQKALVEARETAESASRSKSIFLANMSHEIRTPMNAILGYSQLLQREKGFSPKQKEFLDIISGSGEHLLALINDILEMSKIEAGRITLRPEAGNIQILFRDMERMFRIRAEEKGLSLKVVMGEEVPPWIFADHDKIRQVLLNLLSNALKFTSSGGITVRINREISQEEKRDMFLVVEVEDTGCGIPPEELEKVFSSFEQTSSGIRHGGGTGLGMSISRQYARLMHGDIAVESEPGRGSLFRFSFPCTGTLPVASGEKKKQIRGFDFQGQEVRILVVDDNATNRDMLVQMLEQAGFVTAEAEGGEEGLGLFQSWNPHVILMDYRMGDMDGYEATDRIRQAPGGEKVPIIMVTASVLEEKRKEALERGINGFLRKPFRREELFAEMASHLSLKAIYEELSPEEGAITLEEPFAEEFPSGDVLPEELRRSLIEATEFGDEERFRELLEEVRKAYPPLGNVLSRMLENFDYEGILRVLREEEKA